jgi:hypothetical protein
MTYFMVWCSGVLAGVFSVALAAISGPIPPSNNYHLVVFGIGSAWLLCCAAIHERAK